MLKLNDKNATWKANYFWRYSKWTKIETNLNRRISRLLSTILRLELELAASLICKSDNSFSIFLCFLRCLTSSGFMYMKTCSSHNSRSNDSNSCLMSLKRKEKPLEFLIIKKDETTKSQPIFGVKKSLSHFNSDSKVL